MGLLNSNSDPVCIFGFKVSFRAGYHNSGDIFLLIFEKEKKKKEKNNRKTKKVGNGANPSAH